MLSISLCKCHPKLQKLSKIPASNLTDICCGVGIFDHFSRGFFMKKINIPFQIFCNSVYRLEQNYKTVELSDAELNDIINKLCIISEQRNIKNNRKKQMEMIYARQGNCSAARRR